MLKLKWFRPVCSVTEFSQHNCIFTLYFRAGKSASCTIMPGYAYLQTADDCWNTSSGKHARYYFPPTVSYLTQKDVTCLIVKLTLSQVNIMLGRYYFWMTQYSQCSPWSYKRCPAFCSSGLFFNQPLIKIRCVSGLLKSWLWFVLRTSTSLPSFSFSFPSAFPCGFLSTLKLITWSQSQKGVKEPILLPALIIFSA